MEGREASTSSSEGGGLDMDALGHALDEAESVERAERSSPAEPLCASRTAVRRAVRRDARASSRVEARLRSRAAKAEQRAEARAARAANSAPPPDERYRYWGITLERRARTAARHAAREAMRASWADPHARGVRVAIDLGMEALMCASELASLAVQLRAAYGEVLNRAIERREHAPLRLALTGIADAPRTLAALDNVERWGMQLCREDFGRAVPALCASTGRGEAECPPIVVLSPDAADVLLEVRLDEVYVVGGLCDAKRIANVTASRAAERGVRAARLPIDETFGASDMLNILTVNQVIVALMVMANCSDWRVALCEAIPPRKLRVAGVDRHG
ncbi:hypothetical protein KFE25_009291 [Diacronema lutheri]|uniref:tRNA (guanine(9)-N(1))-methyltransferase n=1 Tax=Diacronema lutheri TaxID=2081491 RepID=A0A8J6CI15_DIALT|nr:hypothetical protein KFE25_009291 [Diacronema lutheri]